MGTLCVLLFRKVVRAVDFCPAKLKTPNETPNVTRTKVAKIRGLMNASFENEFFFMVGLVYQPKRPERSGFGDRLFRSLGIEFGWLVSDSETTPLSDAPRRR